MSNNNGHRAVQPSTNCKPHGAGVNGKLPHAPQSERRNTGRGSRVFNHAKSEKLPRKTQIVNTTIKKQVDEVHAVYDYRGHYIEPPPVHPKEGTMTPEEKALKEYLESRQRDNFVREHVLKSGAMGHSGKTVHQWAPLKLRLLLFVSSTFTDTGFERNLLQESVVPRLRDIARSHGIEISLFDLRWGVRDENTLDHQTWESCFKELLNCAEKSMGNFFLSLQGGKYGYCPIPRTIERTLFDERMATVENEEAQALAKEWYILDENAIPVVYVLKPLKSLNDGNFWNVALPKLRKALINLPFWPANERVVVGHSVSEYEFLEAERLGIERCSWLKREIEGGRDEDSDPWQLYSEWNHASMGLLLKNLLGTMVSSFGVPSSSTSSDSVVRDISVRSDDLFMRTIQDGDATIDISYNHEKYSEARVKQETLDYGEKWKALAFSSLSKEVARCVAVSDAWNAHSEGLGVPGVVCQEMLHHYVWGYEKLTLFSGREDLLEEALNVLDKVVLSPICSDDKNGKGGEMASLAPTEEVLRCVTLAIFGVSGAGKTAFCAKLADILYNRETSFVKVHEDYERRPVLLRFCGTSAGSSTGTMLLFYLCRQLHFILGKSHLDSHIPGKYEERVKYFHALMEKHPVILIIDSLDQLSNEDEARSNLTFLRGMKSHPRSLVIVSTIPDDEIYMFGCSSRLSEANVPIVKVPLHAEPKGAVRFMTDLMRKRYQRCLSCEQLDFVMSKSKKEPTALWFTLAAIIASTWTSTMPLYNPVVNPDGCALSAGVKPLIEQILMKISHDFGTELVRTALTILTVSKNGIKSSEMEDMLSMCDVVLDEVFQYSKPNIRRIPVHVWLRLKNTLDKMVVDVADGCFVWYHRQLHEAATERYTKFEDGKYAIRAHKLLAQYFGNKVPPEMVKARHIALQPRVLKGNVWFSHDTTINIRRVQEAASSYSEYLHLTRDSLELPEFLQIVEEAVDEICTLEAICCSHRVYEGMKLSMILQKIKETLQHRINKEIGVEDPNGEGAYVPSEELLQLKAYLKKVDNYWRWVLRDSTTLHNASEDHVAALVTATASTQPTSGAVHQDLLELRLEYYPTNATVKDMRIGGGEIWLRAMSLGIQNDDSELLMTMKGHHDDLNAVILSPNNLLVASAANDNLIKIWSLNNGECICTLQGHNEHVKCITMDGYDSNMLLSGSLDHTMRLWDIRSGVCLEQWDTGTSLNAVAMTEYVEHHCAPGMSGRIIGAGESGVIKVYRRGYGDRIEHELEGHKESCTALSVSLNGSLLASASDDKTARLWNLGTGDCLTVLSGHKYHVRAVSISWDGTFCFTGSDDKTVKVWDISGAIAGSNDNLGTCKHTIECQAHVLGVAAADDNDKVAVATQSRVLEVWALRLGERLNTLEGHTGRISSVCMSHDGSTLVSCANDRAVCVWDVAEVQENSSRKQIESTLHPSSSKSTSTKRHYHGHTGPMTALCCHSTSTLLVSACEDHSIKLWDVEHGAFRGEIKGYPALVMCLCVSPDGNFLLTGARDNLVKVWSLAGIAEGKTEMSSRESLVRDLVGHTDWVRALEFSRNGEIVASCGNDCTARLFQLETGECLHILKMHTGHVNHLDFSPDGLFLVTGSSDRAAALWDVSTGECKHTYTGHTNRVTAVALCQGRTEDDDTDIIVTCSADGEIRLWRFDGQALGVLASGLGTISSVNVSPTDLNKIIVTEDMRFCVFDVVEKVCVFSSVDLAGHIRAATITACGKRVVTGDASNTIKVWDMCQQQRERVRTIK